MVIFVIKISFKDDSCMKFSVKKTTDYRFYRFITFKGWSSNSLVYGMIWIIDYSYR